ncbi:hypothetical protein [Cryptosporangium sp. NPDC051539]|uniref:hypothetical protein n=1 Tax=Cryptosporangium sp. NPDC051539 TaxID=3363962 RepID=UPI003796B1E4
MPPAAGFWSCCCAGRRTPTLIAVLVGAVQAVQAAGADPDRRARVLTVLLDGLKA